MSDEQRQLLPITLDDFRERLEGAADASGLALDFLMRSWNGRFATYNVGLPTAEPVDGRRGVRGETRFYKLLGRVKAAQQGAGLLLTLSPPTACDLAPTPAEQARWEQFVARLALDLPRDTPG